MDSSPPPRRRGRPPNGDKDPSAQVLQPLSGTIDDFLGPLPLLEGEDRAGYLALLDEMRRQVSPKDLIEQMYIRDVVDLTWELMRTRRIKVAILHRGQVKAINYFADTNIWPSLSTAAKLSIRNEIAKGFSQGLRALEKHGVSLQDINAHAFAVERQVILQLDQSMMQIEARRNFALREIDKRRAAFGRRLDEGIRQVELNQRPVPVDGSTGTTEEP